MRPRTAGGVALVVWAACPGAIAQPGILAQLEYDGRGQGASLGQDFEPVLDAFDVAIIEDAQWPSAPLGEFRSRGIGTIDPAGATDVVCRVFEDNGTGLPGTAAYTGAQVCASVPGAGLYDGADFVTRFDGQTAGGSVFLVFHARLDYLSHGQALFMQQGGAPGVGGGAADNAWQWNPGGGFGAGTHFPVRMAGTAGAQTGVNYTLRSGEAGGCDGVDPGQCGDWDASGGQSDGNDFFAFLDGFATGDPCTDLAAPPGRGSEDFFAFLDRFVRACP
ncbi:MAG: hypothetical protein H6811_04985 [Phycisphaeraceae bacterium]|nr:hypothetical protein [Phycisphaeraceae bacterium]